jgi:hypothetical protein
MTGRFHSRGAAVLLLLLPLFLPLASATGGGLLLDGSSFTVAGEGGVGAGDVNISVDVAAHDVDASGFLQMALEAANGTPLASDNRSINLLTGQSSTEVFDVTDVPIGIHTLTLRLWGSVGVAFENNLTEIQVFVQRLSPADASIEDPSTWQLIPVDADTGEASGNASFRDGDLGWLLAGIHNSGDVTWTGIARHDGQDLSIQVPGSSTTVANFSTGPYGEGTTSITIELLEANVSIDSESTSLSIGPPPLARPLLTITPSLVDPSLGSTVNWTVELSNAGDVVYDGELVCTFPSGIEVLNQSVNIAAGTNISSIIPIEVRPGELTCSTSTDVRIHDDSMTETSQSYDMAAGHLMRAGSDGLTVTGGPFHIGDAVPLAILIHNGGDLAGAGSLQTREGAGDGSNMGAWASLESRSLEVGSSIELGADHLPAVAGDRRIEWRITSTDSLVAADLSGWLDLQILPSQDLEVSLTSLGWTLADGLSVKVVTTLSTGEARTILLEIGTEGAAGEALQISTEVTLSPGQRTQTYNLGQPTVSSLAWVRATPVGWTAASTAEAETALIKPDPRVSVSLGTLDPSEPTGGEAATLAYSLVNDGGGATLGGTLTLIDISSQKILWTNSAPAVASGEAEQGSIALVSWPEGEVVDLSLEWRTPTTEAEEAGSWLTQSASAGGDEQSFDWTSLGYGALIGVLLGLVTRTVMRAKSGEPLLRSRDRSEAKAKRAEKKKTDAEEKVEVACPACDQRLRLPSTYTGTARCPACAQTFPVEGIEPESVQEDEDEPDEESDEESDEDFEEEPEEEVEVKELTSASSDDVIRCPDCDQKLKVPYDRRPVRARCPSCKSEFRALKE